MVRWKIRNPPLTGRRSQKGTTPDKPAGQHKTKTDLTALRLRAMDAVLLDPQRLYDATLCSPDEFDYILHLYEEWLERNHLYHYFRSDAAGGRAVTGMIYPRHALLMVLADKKANVPMEMLADLFGTDIDRVRSYMTMANKALIEVLSAPTAEASPKEIWGTKVDPPSTNLSLLSVEIPMATPEDPIRPHTAESYPGLLSSKRTSPGAGPKEDADTAGRRVEEARMARVALDTNERLEQYRRLMDPFAGQSDLGTELGVIFGLENFHISWDQIREKNGPLLTALAKKREQWGTQGATA